MKNTFLKLDVVMTEQRVTRGRGYVATVRETRYAPATVRLRDIKLAIRHDGSRPACLYCNAPLFNLVYFYKDDRLTKEKAKEKLVKQAVELCERRGITVV